MHQALHGSFFGSTLSLDSVTRRCMVPSSEVPYARTPSRALQLHEYNASQHCGITVRKNNWQLHFGAPASNVTGTFSAYTPRVTQIPRQTPLQKRQLSRNCCVLSAHCQVSTWFANSRRRIQRIGLQGWVNDQVREDDKLHKGAYLPTTAGMMYW